MIRDKLKRTEIRIVIKQNILENRAKIVYLAIGSNLGNKFRNIEIAKFKLQNYKIKIIECSSNYESLSWPNSKNPSESVIENSDIIISVNPLDIEYEKISKNTKSKIFIGNFNFKNTIPDNRFTFLALEKILIKR